MNDLDPTLESGPNDVHVHPTAVKSDMAKHKSKYKEDKERRKRSKDRDNKTKPSASTKKVSKDQTKPQDYDSAQNLANKLTAKLMPPTQTLHIANLPDGYGHADIKEMFIEKGFTVKESTECGQSGNMAILNMARYFLH